MNDFADWLSPIVVKELRQGMRSRVFVGTFLIIQFFMIFCVAGSLGERGEREFGTGMFWTLFVISILIATPLRGLGALSGEIKGNTLDLVLLTQLSAWRIAFGKWAALFLQSALVACSVLPYVILRYFVGGVNLTEELVVMGWILFASALLTALAIALSPYIQSIVARLFLGGCIFSIMSGLNSLDRIVTHGGIAAGPGAVVAIVLGVLVFLGLLEIATAKIAPVGEDHTIQKRLLVLAIVATTSVFGWWCKAPELFAVLCAVLVTPVCLPALVEEVPVVPRVHRPFSKRGRLGMLPGIILSPGWPSGLIFTGIVITALIFSAHLDMKDSGTFYRIVAGIGGITVPLGIGRLCFSRRGFVPVFFFCFQTVAFVFSILISVNRDYFSGLLFVGAIVPTMGFFLSLWDQSQLSATVELLTTGAVTLAGIVALLFASIPEWKRIAQLRREGAEME